MTRIILDRYELLETIGMGAMGIVYRAHDRVTDQLVAIKQLKGNVGPDQLVRFQREGDALRQLNHPNIVHLIDTIHTAGHHYLVMEYVNAGDLGRLIASGTLTIEAILRLAIDLADALTRAHKIGIIHRDLKPANTLIADDGTLRLTDFGISQMVQAQRITDENVIMGTVNYIAPEALNGQAIDTRVDIWAFGVILFEMLTQRHPFATDTPSQTMMNILTAELPRLEVLRPDAPLGLADLVYRMLERDPQARIGNIRLVAAELSAIADGSNPQLRSPVLSDQTTIIQPTTTQHNLPLQGMPFVGRKVELAELARLLQNPMLRCISVVGPGGMGKTRLAIEAARQHLSAFADGVYFVDLAPLSEPESIIPAIADALGFTPVSGPNSLQAQLLNYLEVRQALVVLDNYEHLIEAANVVSDLVQATQFLKILATTRQKLNLTIETLFLLDGMDFPTWEIPDDALQYAAVKLFMQSAKRTNPRFELTSVNMNDVARICKQVEGLPLGIILAASWLSMLSVQEVADEIAAGVDFLSSDFADLPERQRSIRAVFDYSWHLLTDAERDVFMKLSIFRGGFDRNAAESVAGADLRTLMALMNKSLLQRDPDTGRYGIHDLVRQYGQQRLDTAKLFEMAKTRHLQHYRTYLMKIVEQTKNSDVLLAARNRLLDIEYGNLQGALLWAATDGHDEEFIDLYHVYTSYMDERTRLVEWERFIQHVIQILHARSKPVIADVWVYLWDSYIRVCGRAGRYAEARKYFERATALADQVKNAEIRWGIYLSPIFFAVHEHEYIEAKQYLEKGLVIAQQLNTQRILFSTYNGLGIISIIGKHYEQALVYLQKAIDIASETLSAFNIAVARHNIAFIYMLQGNYEAAVEIHRQNESQDNDAVPPWAQVVNLVDFVQVLLLLDRIVEAQARAIRLLEVARQNHLRDTHQIAIIYLAEIAARRGAVEQALQWYAAAHSEDIEYGSIDLWHKTISVLLNASEDSNAHHISRQVENFDLETVTQEVMHYYGIGRDD